MKNAGRCGHLTMSCGDASLRVWPDVVQVSAPLNDEFRQIVGTELHVHELAGPRGYATVRTPNHDAAYTWFRALADSGDLHVTIAAPDDTALELLRTFAPSVAHDLAATLTLERSDAIALAKDVPHHHDGQQWSAGATDVSWPQGTISTTFVMRSDFDANKAAWMATIDAAFQLAVR